MQRDSDLSSISVLAAGRDPVQRVFLRARPVHHGFGPARPKHPDSAAWFLHLPNAGGGSWCDG